MHVDQLCFVVALGFYVPPISKAMRRRNLPSERLEKPGIKLTIPGKLNHSTSEAFRRQKYKVIINSAFGDNSYIL